jgi:hypothetical protein
MCPGESGAALKGGHRYAAVVPSSEGAPALELGLQAPLAPLAMSYCSLKLELIYFRGKHNLATGLVAINNKLATGLVANNNN